MKWKLREDYKALQEKHKPILTRSTWTGPMVVIYTDMGPTPGWHFYTCPGTPIFFGNNAFGMLIHDHFDEWMDIPE